MTIGNLQFLQASMPSSYQQGGIQQQGYHQAQGVPNTTAQIQPSFKPSIEDYEKAQSFIDGGSTGLNPFLQPAQQMAQKVDPRGAAWDGFPTLAQNDSRELSPVIAGREDEIIGLDFKA